MESEALESAYFQNLSREKCGFHRKLDEKTDV